MTLAASYVNGQFLEDALANASAFDLSGTPDTIKVALFKTSITGDDKNASESYGTGAWATTYEVANSGDYAAGGGTPGTLTTPSLSSASGKLIFTEADATMVWSGCTWATTAAPHAAGVYDSTVSSRLMCGIRFGASDYPVTAGTFTITWDTTNKIWYATY